MSDVRPVCSGEIQASVPEVRPARPEVGARAPDGSQAEIHQACLAGSVIDEKVMRFQVSMHEATRVHGRERWVISAAYETKRGTSGRPRAMRAFLTAPPPPPSQAADRVVDEVAGPRRPARLQKTWKAPRTRAAALWFFQPADSRARARSMKVVPGRRLGLPQKPVASRPREWVYPVIRMCTVHARTTVALRHSLEFRARTDEPTDSGVLWGAMDRAVGRVDTSWGHHQRQLQDPEAPGPGSLSSAGVPPSS